MLCEGRWCSQFNIVFSRCFGIRTLTDMLLSMHGGETIPNHAKTTKKSNNALCHQGSRLRLLRGKGLYFRKCRQGNQCCKNSTAIAVNSIFVILWTSQREHILRMLIAKETRLVLPYFFIKPLERAYIIMSALYQILLLLSPLPLP